MLIVFDDMIADMTSNKKLNSTVTKLFCCAKKKIRLNSTHYVFIKIQNKRELQQSAYNHS